MIRLLVIADDFTGALDTGIQFKARGTRIRVFNRERTVFTLLDDNIQVLIVDTETRHLPPTEAYQVVHRIVAEAMDLGIPCIYKKTDSGLRGNIGSELTGMLDASGRKRIHFAPAFPQMDRKTIHGVHYISDQPVAESVFGSDPFEPVCSSYIPEIIASQSPVETHQLTPGTTGDLPCGVLIYDSSTDQDLERVARNLARRNELHLLAGCAGFASVLSNLLGLDTGGVRPPVLQEDLLVVCGSINPITICQMDEAERQGAARIRMRLEQKLGTDWLSTPDGNRCLTEWMTQIEQSRCAILESASSMEAETAQQYADRLGLPREEIRHRISNTMGTILEQLINRGLRRTMLVTGGDTLMSFMERLQINELSPICQLFPGVVLSQIQYRGSTYNLISKSGGFGAHSLLMDLANMIHSPMKEELVC